ncbi:MAG: DNA-binding protein [Rhodospirillaceae bacterium]|nr:DNA-binding protein [Rhodospirillaceae bacterium]|tara:strand:- start:960 stop:1370 length:411 start_codon:yes stop_codon:yes gene_type:complete
MSADNRELPNPTPETQHFWDGTRLGELRIQRCHKCEKTYFPPRHFCPSCGSKDVSVLKATGRATLHSYIISHLPAPGFIPPYAIAIAKLEEGPKMMCNIVGCEQTPEALILDMPLEVTFEKVSEEITLPQFKPREG